MGNISEEDGSMYLQATTAMSQQRISNTFRHKQAWAVLISNYGATVISIAYPDLRARFYGRAGICNQHVLLIPIHEGYTGEHIFDALCKALMSLVGEGWKSKLIGIATDGAANLIGKLSAAVTRFRNVCEGGWYCALCRAVQLALKVQTVFEEHVKESIQDPHYRLISNFHRQTNLISDMCSKYPTVFSTRWLALGNVCHCIVQHLTKLCQYFDFKKPAQCPGMQ